MEPIHRTRLIWVMFYNKVCNKTIKVVYLSSTLSHTAEKCKQSAVDRASLLLLLHAEPLMNSESFLLNYIKMPLCRLQSFQRN
jgi:hypothetical protein